MRFSIRLNNDLPVSAYPRLAAAAEAVGFDQFWVSNDLFLRSVPVALGVCHLSFGPPLGPDPLAAIEMPGRDVLPVLAS